MSGKDRMQAPAACCHSGAVMFVNRDEKAAKNPDWRSLPRGPKRPESNCRWRGRLKIPRHAHPFVRRLIGELNKQDMTMHELAEQSGVHVRTIQAWRWKNLPKIDLLEACFNALGLRLVIEKLDDDDRAPDAS